MKNWWWLRNKQLTKKKLVQTTRNDPFDTPSSSSTWCFSTFNNCLPLLSQQLACVFPDNPWIVGKDYELHPSTCELSYKHANSKYIQVWGKVNPKSQEASLIRFFQRYDVITDFNPGSFGYFKIIIIYFILFYPLTCGYKISKVDHPFYFIDAYIHRGAQSFLNCSHQVLCKNYMKRKIL